MIKSLAAGGETARAFAVVMGIVQDKTHGAAEASKTELQKALDEQVPGARIDVRQLDTGKPIAMPVEIRISGDDMAALVGEEIVAPFREHHVVDLDNHHNAVSAELFVEVPPLNRRQQDAIYRAVLQYHQFVIEQGIQVARYYADATSPLPFTAATTVSEHSVRWLSNAAIEVVVHAVVP